MHLLQKLLKTWGRKCTLRFPNADTVLLGRGNGVPVNIIHTTYQKGLGAIIYKSESGIHKIQDLKGKTIAITSYGSPNYIQLKVILQQNGYPSMMCKSK